MARISEIHYSNAYASSSGEEEFLEVVLSPAEQANEADYTVSFYGTNGNVIGEFTLDSLPASLVTFDAETNEYVYVLPVSYTGIFLTDPGGNNSDNSPAWALTDTSTSPNTVIQFIDIGTAPTEITANNGAAAGETSTNIPAAAPNPNNAPGSIQFNAPDPTTAVYEPVTPGDSGDICFVAGSLIETPNGPVPIEDLEPGDLVLTRDNGIQRLRWIGRREVEGTGKSAPIRISKGTFGAVADIWVSPNHRVALCSPLAELIGSNSEFLVPAKMLLDHPGVFQIARDRVCYVHILFDQHELVKSSGLWTESFFPGQTALGTIEQDVRAEVLALFPELEADPKGRQLCLPELKPFEARLLAGHCYTL